MSTTKGGNTVIPLAGEASPACSVNGPPAHCRRKMKKLCCCLTFLLLMNLLLTMHVAHDLCHIMRIFYSDDMVLMPGGSQSFCNDFCVDLCINDADNFKCDLMSCLNNCNSHFGNEQVAMMADDVEVEPARQARDMPPPPPTDGDEMPPPQPEGERPPPPPQQAP
mmetsp:Transcript_42658/g.68480  ORF Transcript_42658/g.68480 Transcript_42658/m.68480 type:complete len:165 (+) Transcript_42658:75-569(+)|eukprot:CAMPEP_0197020802 /NCGR_PEP_ID=MMETSP1384-20130603/1686_1 /TAXON_ID=29189 /ORGANISM="Ammonia sp." /LENGTH=164 /DNA_ID=CAMNT_0042448493 /DNA_START=75 /DNA_END=569 /DNA_ORIENTATION=-